MPLSPQITITPEDISYKSFDISAVTYTSTTATYTAIGHTLSVGDIVMITGLAPDTYNGTYTITAIATNTFTVANTTNLALTDQIGNVYWTDPTEYSYDGGQTVTYIPNDNDVNAIVDGNATVNEAYTKAVQALSDAATALSEANTAYTLASTSLQKSANTIVNASNQLTAINGNGITVYSGGSATSGARVVLNSAGIAGFNSSGSATFSIDSSTGNVSISGALFTGGTISGGSLNIAGNCIINSSGYLTATGATITGNITATSGSFTGSIYASGGTIGGFTIQSTYLSGSGGFTLYSNGTIDGGNSNTLYYGYVNVGGGFPSGARFQVNGNSEFTGTVIATGSITAQGELYAAGHSTTTNAANGYVFTTGGRIARSTASSERYKEDIVDLVSISELDPKKLLNLPVRAFRYKADHLNVGDDRFNMLIPGFIAEEVDSIYPIAADYIDGPESWNDRIMVPALLALIQDLYKEVNILKGAN